MSLLVRSEIARWSDVLVLWVFRRQMAPGLTVSNARPRGF